MTSDQKERRRRLLTDARRIVVKVGSGVLTGEKYEDLDENVVSRIVGHVAGLTESGCKVAVVSSGSVSLGTKALGIPRRGLPIPVQQAAAAVGQGRLISLWAKCFEIHGLKVGQVLLTHDDMANRRRFLNSRNTINSLFDFGAIPIINENDTVAVHEIKFGDNDTLSARVTNLMEADLLAILSDVDGLYSADPRLDKEATKIEFVEEVDEGIFAVAGDSSSRTGLGGMASKVRAAKEASRFGASTIILPGARENSLKDAMEGGDIGTFFFPHDDPMNSKKHWIEFTLKPRGALVVDGGARQALLTMGKSLLASGVASVEGDFESGEAVEVKGPDGAVFGKGLVNYHSHEMEKIKGCRSSEIENILGYKFYDEVMHRDDMVLLK
ncbi:MAG: glutamate 5-kinase [Nitrospinota bacterium]|nr:glutamate 5-kinase [Nitrospinota bacterium]